MNKIKAMDVILSNGNTVRLTEKRHNERIEQVYKSYWDKGISPKYQDERCKAPNEFIAANKDGSEDLVKFNAEDRTYSVISRVSEIGKGKFAYLLDQTNAK